MILFLSFLNSMSIKLLCCNKSYLYVCINA